MKNKTNRINIGVFIVATMLLGLASFLFPAVPESAQADSSVDFSATIEPSFNVTILSDGASVQDLSNNSYAAPIEGVVPTGNGTLRFSDLRVKIYSNSATGYILNMTTDSASLVGEHTGNTIEPLDDVSGGYTPEQFTNNRWGYSVGSVRGDTAEFTNFFPVKNGINKVAISDNVANGEEKIVRLGTKLDYLAVPDTYSTTLNFTIVANITE